MRQESHGHTAHGAILYGRPHLVGTLADTFLTKLDRSLESLAVLLAALDAYLWRASDRYFAVVVAPEDDRILLKPLELPVLTQYRAVAIEYVGRCNDVNFSGLWPDSCGSSSCVK